MKRKEGELGVERGCVLEVGETGERRGERAAERREDMRARRVTDDEDRKYLLASNASSLPSTTRIEHLKCPYFDRLRKGLYVCVAHP